MNKVEILKQIHEKLASKIKTLQDLISETRASNHETKSSMGDKYETGREMLQQEINHLQSQLRENLKLKQILAKISPQACKRVGLGALIQTENNYFYVCVSLGNLMFEGVKINLISVESPLAQAMQNKLSGEDFSLPQTSQKIINIW